VDGENFLRRRGPEHGRPRLDHRLRGPGPIKSGVWIADWITGLMCANAILSALNYRERTGEGQFIDYLQVENGHPAARLGPGSTRSRRVKTGSGRGTGTWRSAHRTFSNVSTGRWRSRRSSEAEFRGLCEAMGQMDLHERFRDPLTRLRDGNAAELLDRIAVWAVSRRVEEVEALASSHGFAAARVLEAKDVYHSAHFRSAAPSRSTRTPSTATWSSSAIPPC